MSGGLMGCSETEWEIYWCDKNWIRGVYDKVHLDAHQKVNHFRNFYEVTSHTPLHSSSRPIFHFFFARQITRKDLLIKNLQRTKRALQKKGRHEEAALYDFAPQTYSLPTEYLLFVEAFKKAPDTKWIAKPVLHAPPPLCTALCVTCGAASSFGVDCAQSGQRHFLVR
jgi:hypothetical protein